MFTKTRLQALSVVCATKVVSDVLCFAASPHVSARPSLDAEAKVVSTQTTKQPAKTIHITYSQEGMKQTAKANLFTSPQGYYMYILEGYLASAEEPSKDIVLFKRNPYQFMRIEKLPSGVDLKSVRDNVVLSLKSIGKVAKMDPKSFADPFFRQASFIYHAHAKDAYQTAVVMKIQRGYYRILINTVKETESIAPYLAMIKTIASVNANPGNSDSSSERGIVAGALVPAIFYNGTTGGGVLKYTIQLKNQTERVQKLTFNTGQKYDFIVSNDGAVVQQYSRGKSFTQNVSFVELKQGEELHYPIELNGLKPGHYHLSAWVTYAGWDNSSQPKAFREFNVCTH